MPPKKAEKKEFEQVNPDFFDALSRLIGQDYLSMDSQKLIDELISYYEKLINVDPYQLSEDVQKLFFEAMYDFEPFFTEKLTSDQVIMFTQSELANPILKTVIDHTKGRSRNRLYALFASRIKTAREEMGS